VAVAGLSIVDPFLLQEYVSTLGQEQSVQVHSSVQGQGSEPLAQSLRELLSQDVLDRVQPLLSDQARMWAPGQSLWPDNQLIEPGLPCLAVKESPVALDLLQRELSTEEELSMREEESPETRKIRFRTSQLDRVARSLME
jgi:hypothetical protein